MAPVEAIDGWCAPGAAAWQQALRPLTAEQRRIVVDTLRAYEQAVTRQGRWWSVEVTYHGGGPGPGGAISTRGPMAVGTGGPSMPPGLRPSLRAEGW